MHKFAYLIYKKHLSNGDHNSHTRKFGTNTQTKYQMVQFKQDIALLDQQSSPKLLFEVFLNLLWD